MHRRKVFYLFIYFFWVSAHFILFKNNHILVDKGLGFFQGSRGWRGGQLILATACRGSSVVFFLSNAQLVHWLTWVILGLSIRQSLISCIILESQISSSFPYCSAVSWITTLGMGVSAGGLWSHVLPWHCWKALGKPLGIGYNQSSGLLRTQQPWGLYEEPLPFP